MEFFEKLQQLRKQKGITQEELAQSIYVSRTAISKWESGRGYPCIDSLRAIAQYFSISVDELLSTDELLTVAKEDGRRRERRIRDRIFASLDLSAAALLFLPLFADRTEETVRSVSLFAWSLQSTLLWISCLTVILATILFGAVTVALHRYAGVFWNRYKNLFSLTLSVVAVLLFTVSLHPYAAIFAFALLAVKASILLRRI